MSSGLPQSSLNVTHKWKIQEENTLSVPEAWRSQTCNVLWFISLSTVAPWAPGGDACEYVLHFTTSSSPFPRWFRQTDPIKLYPASFSTSSHIKTWRHLALEQFILQELDKQNPLEVGRDEGREENQYSTCANHSSLRHQQCHISSRNFVQPAVNFLM